MSAQNEAIRLANALCTGTYLLSQERDNTFRELIRLNESNKLMLEALKSVWLWMESQADGQSKGGHASFDLLMLREQRDIARAAIDKVEPPEPVQREQCMWSRPDSDHMPDTWEAGCGAMWTFTEGGPKDNDMRFCPGCGKQAIEAAKKIKLQA